MSVVDALGRALATTRDVCFRPFEPTRWLVLGVVAFLATCGEAGLPSAGGGGEADDGAPWGSDFAGWASEALRWTSENAALVAAIGAALFVVIAGIVALTTWISSHGKLVFVDAIARGGEAHVGRAWREYADEAWSLFLLRLAVGLAAAVLLALLAVPVLVPALRYLAGSPLEPGEIAVAVPAVGVMALVALSAGLLRLAIDELLVPALYLRRGTVRTALEALREALSGRAGAALGYLAVRSVAGLLAGLLLVVLGFLTCCLGFLPLVGHVLFLPVYVYLRSLSLAWLAQRGPDWSVFPSAPTGPPSFGDPPGDPG